MLSSKEGLVGEQVWTPYGHGKVVQYNAQRAAYTVELASGDRETMYHQDIYEIPMPENPAKISAWIDGPTYGFQFGMLATKKRARCACACGHCSRGALHMIDPYAICQCEQRQCSCVTD